MLQEKVYLYDIQNLLKLETEIAIRYNGNIILKSRSFFIFHFWQILWTETFVLKVIKINLNKKMLHTKFANFKVRGAT